MYFIVVLSGCKRYKRWNFKEGIRKKSSDIIDFYTNKYGVKLNGFEEKVDELRKFAGI